MKIKQFIHLVLAGSLLLLAAASCTDEVITKNEGGTDPTVPEGMQALTLKVGGISSGSVTKAGVIAKPEEIAVEDMTIYVFKYDPALGADDTDDNNYTFLDYWTYMKTPLTGYTADSRELRTFTLGGSGQFRTATIYVPKEARKVKCMVMTGIGLITAPERAFIWVLGSGENLTLLSGILFPRSGIDNPSSTASGYAYMPFESRPQGIQKMTLKNMKEGLWEKLPEVKKSTSGTATTVYPGFWKTPLSMAGETALLNIGSQSGNSSQLTATLQRHVARLDMINNNLKITKIELINLPVMTPLIPAVDGVKTSDFVAAGMGTNATAAVTGEPAATYTLYEAYTGTAASPFSAITQYVYPNVPYNTTDNTTYTPFIRVTIDGEAQPFILPFQTRNPETKDVTPVDLKSNHRYTLQFNKLGDNMLDYNIVIAPWVAGEDFTANLGDDVTQTQLEYVPAITAEVAYNATTNATKLIGEKLYLYYQEGTPGTPYTCKWQFTTANTLADKKFNILACASPTGIMGDAIDATNITVADNNVGAVGTSTHTVVLPDVATDACPYGTAWYVLQNPYNAGKYSRVKMEYRVPGATAFDDLFLLEETNVGSVLFKASHYNTEWPVPGQSFSFDDVRGSFSTLPYLGKLCPPAEGTEGVDLSAAVNKYKAKEDGSSYYITSSGSQAAPCMIGLFTPANPTANPIYLTMWERIRGADGNYYIRIVKVLARNNDLWDDEVNTQKSFIALRSFIYNVENGNKYDFSYLTRYLPEGNYWTRNGNFSFHYQTLGKSLEYGGNGYIRKERANP